MEDTYSGLSISVRRREDQGLYQFGVYLDGAFVVIGGRKLGGVDDDIAAAKAAAANEQGGDTSQSGSTPAPLSGDPGPSGDQTNQ